MATKIPRKFKVKQACGHPELTDLSKIVPDQPHKWNQAFADKLSQQNLEKAADGEGWVCKDCFNEGRKSDERQWDLDIEQFEQKYQLPEFTGSDKQLASEPLVKAARRNRHSVLQELFEEPTEEAKSQHGTLLDAARTVTFIGFWANTLDYKTRQDNGYGPPEYIALLNGAYQSELEFQAKRSDGEGYVETENPHDWDGYQD